MEVPIGEMDPVRLDGKARRRKDVGHKAVRGDPQGRPRPPGALPVD